MDLLSIYVHVITDEGIAAPTDEEWVQDVDICTELSYHLFGYVHPSSP